MHGATNIRICSNWGNKTRRRFHYGRKPLGQILFSCFRGHHSVMPIVWPFSFLGGSADVPTRSVSLHFHLLVRSAPPPRQRSPPPGRPPPEKSTPEWRAFLLLSLLILHLFPLANFFVLSPFPCVSPSLCLSIHQSQPFSRLLRSRVSERWTGCLTAKKTCSSVFILHLTQCKDCSCLWLSASSAAFHKTLFPFSYQYLSITRNPNPSTKLFQHAMNV